MSHDYHPGDIVRFGEYWGVVRRMGFDHGPMVDWWVGQYDAAGVEPWLCQKGCLATDLSAPFSVDYVGIPGPVIARSMQIILTQESV